MLFLTVESEHEEDDNEPASPVRKFSWEDTIIELLDNADDKTLAVKRLRKKVHVCLEIDLIVKE